MHGKGWYARTSDLFDMPRIQRNEWKVKAPAAPDSTTAGEEPVRGRNL